MTAQIDSQELSDYISSTIEAVERSANQNPSWELTTHIKFELAVVNATRAEGGLKIFVVNASGKFDNKIVSKITFEIGKKMDVSNVRPRFFDKT